MSADPEKERVEASLIGRIVSLDALLLLMGCLSLIYGIIKEQSINIFWAMIIIPGFFVLRKVRQKDWKKHWEEREAFQKLYDERREAEQKLREKNPSGTNTP